MPSDERSPSWRPWAEGAAVLVVGLGLGLQFLGKSEEPPPAPPAIQAPMPAQPRFAQLLAPYGRDPLLSAFAADFSADASLRQAWNGYLSDGDLPGFLRRLAGNPGFQALKRRYAGNAGFQSAAQNALKEPQIQRLLADAMDTLQARPVAAPESSAGRGALLFPELSDELTAPPSFSRSRKPWALALLALAAAGAALAAGLRRKAAAGAPAAAPEDGAAAPPGPGRLQDRYQIVRALAGSADEQWLEARDPGLDRVVLLRRLARPDAGLRERLAKAAGLRQPAIPEIYEIVEEDGALWVVYERWHGRSLAQLASSGAASPQRAPRVLEPLCRALEAAHARGLFHGALTPDKVLVDEQGFVKLLELGVAAAGEAEQSRAADLGGLALCWRTMTGAIEEPGARSPAEFLRRLRSKVAPEATGAL